VNLDNSVKEHLVHVGARVEPELAEAVAQLAREGDRSLGRQIRRALSEHVAQQLPGVGSAPALGRPEPIERRGLVGPARDWFRWPERDLTPEDIERLEKLQRLEREGDQALRRSTGASAVGAV
jgi:hypothetical protein